MAHDDFDFDGITYRAEKRSPAVFRFLFTVLVVWGVAFMGYFLFSGWSSEGEFAEKRLAQQGRVAAANKAGVPGPPGVQKPNIAGLIAIGKTEYGARCAACHGADAKGGIGPDLTGKKYKYGRTPTAIAETIVAGRPGGMPAFKNDLSQEKIEGLVQYLLSL